MLGPDDWVIPLSRVGFIKKFTGSCSNGSEEFNFWKPRFYLAYNYEGEDSTPASLYVLNGYKTPLLISTELSKYSFDLL